MHHQSHTNLIETETNRVRKFKERFAMTDMRKEANRRCGVRSRLVFVFACLFGLFGGGLGRLSPDDDGTYTHKYAPPSYSTPY